MLPTLLTGHLMGLAALVSLPMTTATPMLTQRAELPAAFILAGDSTTASGKGWGNGFIKTLTSATVGVNLAVSGATILTARSSGTWAKVIAEVTKQKNTHQVFVTIQYGHNDQKVPEAKAGFSANLAALVAEVKAAGGFPIVVSPLTRREFKAGAKGVTLSLADETAKALAVASNTSTRVIDLNAASVAYVNAIGSVEAHKYDLDEGDNTHLNAHGGVVFGRMVSDLLVAKYPALAAFTVKDSVLSGLIAAGKPA